MPVARDHLGRDRLDREPEPGGHRRFDRGRHRGEGADGPADRAGADLPPGGEQPVAAPAELGPVAEELEPEARGLGVDAVRATDARCVAVFAGAAGEGGEHSVEVGQEEIAGAHELDRERGVEQVGARHAAMQPARLRPEPLLEMGEEGDDVVPGRPLDLLDPHGVDQTGPGLLDLPPKGGDVRCRDEPLLGHGLGRHELDLEPEREPCLGREEGGHLGPAVARDHLGTPRDRWRRS